MPRRIDQAAAGQLTPLDPRTLGERIRVELSKGGGDRTTVGKKKPGPKGPTKRKTDKQYFQIGHEVDRAIPRFEGLLQMKSRPARDLVALGYSEQEIEAIRMPGSRTALIAARWYISAIKSMPFDTVAQYHQRSRKNQRAVYKN